MNTDNWKLTLVGLILFFALCFLIADKSENGHGGADINQCPSCDQW